MTIIGQATLQIIPSLLGVTDAIEKQIDGKVVEVKVAPKVDQPAAKKAGKETGETITKEVKESVRKGDIGKSVGEEVTTSVRKSTTGKDVAKIIVDGVAEGVKQELRDGGVGELVVDGIAEGVKQGIDGEGLGGQVVDSIAGGISAGDLGGQIKASVLPTITQIGSVIRSGAAEWSHSIADSLRSGDIQGAASSIATTVQNTTNTIASIGDVFGANTEGIENFGGDVSAAIAHIGDTAGVTKDQVNQVITPMQTLGELAGPDSKLYKASSNLPLIGAIVAAVPALQEASNQLEGIVQKYTGLNVPLSAQSWFRYLTDNGKIFNSAEQNARDKLAAAQAAHEANAAPITRDPSLLPTQHGRAGGGMIPGFSTRDDRIGIIAGTSAIGLAGGEGIINAPATRRLGGAPFINFLNGFSEGGIVPPDVAAAQALAGTGYSQGNRTDCSGMVARVIDRTLGMSESGLMSTKTAAEWLKARGFVSGSGGPGQITVGWYDHGPNPNDGHMAMTLSDGRNAESGGSSGPFTIGGKAAGASSPQFDQHMYLPTVYGEGPAGSSSASPFAGGSAGAAVIGAAPATASSGGGGGGSSAGGGGISLPTSLSGLATMGLSGLGKGVGTTGSGSDLSLFGGAAASAVSGQIDSALGVLGVNGSPGWLKGISQLVGGISIGGSANPLAASPSGMGVPAPGDAANMHGTRAGQAPGPTYNIYARDTEDALTRTQRFQDQRTAGKLSVYG